MENNETVKRVALRSLLLLSTVVILQVSVACQTHSRSSSLDSAPVVWREEALAKPVLRDPIWVYNNWSSYDELSDNIPLTEKLAIRELDEITRLGRAGVHFDYYMMDAFWFDPNGAYRTWRKPNWPNGPDAWIRKCKENGIKPGLWFSTNTLVKINAAPQWQGSLNANKGAMSFYEGGFLPDFMQTLQFWYDHGIRMFKFDFVDFNAATPAAAKRDTLAEIREKNETALREALKQFRQKNSDVVLEAFNGFGGDVESTAGPFPFHHGVDLRWLEVFDAVYSGDPRPSDVPELNFWRSVDIYSDHMVRRYEQSFVPLGRIDSTGFMVGNTGTIYYRKTHAWKGALLLMAARGGWINTTHGNLEFIDDAMARWFARVEAIYRNFQSMGQTKTFGGIPGQVEPYGFASFDTTGAIYTVVNPAQKIVDMDLPMMTKLQSEPANGRVIFRDAGFSPVLKGNRITLGPGQMAAVGFGRYARPGFDLGVQEDVRIPRSIRSIEAKFHPLGKNVIEVTVDAPVEGELRIIFQQMGTDGQIMRSWPGGPPSGTSVGRILKITAMQNGRDIPLEIEYDKQIWSGLSWGAGEVKHGAFVPGAPITIRCFSGEKNDVVLQGKVFIAEY
jgi:hypothetical protein